MKTGQNNNTITPAPSQPGADNACSAPLKIKALQGLHLAVASNKILRLLEVLYAIKAIWVDCPMPYSAAALHQVSAALGLSAKQVDRNINQLITHDLLRVDINRGLEPISWPDLVDRFQLKHKKFYYIDYTPLGEKGHRLRLWKILYCKVKLEKKKQCQVAVVQRIIHNKGIQQILNEVAGTDDYGPAAVAFHQLQNFIHQGAGYDEDARYILSTHFTNKDDRILRGDLEMNKHKWRNVHGYARTGSVIYMDRHCQALGLLKIEERKIKIPGHTTRGSRRHNRQGFIKFEPAEMQLYLIQCNATHILPLTGIQARMQANALHRAQAAQMMAQMQQAGPGKHSIWVSRAWQTRRANALTKQTTNETTVST